MKWPAFSAQDDEAFAALAHMLRPLQERIMCKQYLEARDALLADPFGKMPHPETVSAQVRDATEFELCPMSNLPSNREHIEGFARRKFSCATWMRGAASLNFVEKPDWGHDGPLGHAATLMIPQVADSMELLGLAALDPDKKRFKGVTRLFFWLHEAALLRTPHGILGLGAAIATSTLELDHCLSSHAKRVEFENTAELVRYCIERPVIDSAVQTEYPVLESIDQLVDAAYLV